MIKYVAQAHKSLFKKWPDELKIISRGKACFCYVLYIKKKLEFWALLTQKFCDTLEKRKWNHSVVPFPWENILCVSEKITGDMTPDQLIQTVRLALTLRINNSFGMWNKQFRRLLTSQLNKFGYKQSSVTFEVLSNRWKILIFCLQKWQNFSSTIFFV